MMRIALGVPVLVWLSACANAPRAQLTCSDLQVNTRATGLNFDLEQARIAMTLSAISYVDDTPVFHFNLRDKLKKELAKKHYAMKGKEELVWGPVIYLRTYNLAYVTRNTDTDAYSLVLRGTSPRLRSWWEDVALETVPLPGSCPSQGLLVSRKFGIALNGMLHQVDHLTHQTLDDFFKAQASKHQDMKVYVTGHSQGAGLATMAVAYLSDRSRHWNVRGKLNLTSYAFAPPTAGNATFADLVGQNLVSYQISNPLDVVPFGYASIDGVIREQVPGAIPNTKKGRKLKKSIRAAAIVARKVTNWKQPDQQLHLRRIQLPSSVKYIDQVKIQHIQSAYLYLLGAPPVDFVKPTRLQQYDLDPGGTPFPGHP